MNSSVLKQRWRVWKLWNKLLGKCWRTLGGKLVNGIRSSVFASCHLLKLGYLLTKTKRTHTIFLGGYLSKRWLSGPSERYSWAVKLSSGCEKIYYLKEAEKIYNGKFPTVNALRKGGLSLESEKTVCGLVKLRRMLRSLWSIPSKLGKLVIY